MAVGHDIYFFVDGSALLADVTALRKARKEYSGKRLSVHALVKYFSGPKFQHLTLQCYRRFVFYFVSNEPRVGELLIIPDFTKPGAVDDVHIRYCGKRVRGGKRVDSWLEKHNPPKSVLDRLNRSEKAVDTQICCDALFLAAHGKVDRLFLYTNDYDYIPLCDAIKRCGANVSLFGLGRKPINKDLAANVDSFSVVEAAKLPDMFE